MPSPAPDTCWLYLIRHGATENNLARPPRLQGCGINGGLSEAGRRQAEKTGRFLAELPVAAVYTSPLARARETAEAIAKPHQLEVETIADITEADVGDWEGHSWEEIEQTDTDAYRAFMTDASVHPYLGGENMQSVYDRSAPCFEKLMAENLGRTIVVVAHNVVNRVYLATLLGLPIARYRSVPQDNCGVNLLRYRNGRARVVSVNGLFHLSGDRDSRTRFGTHNSSPPVAAGGIDVSNPSTLIPQPSSLISYSPAPQ